MGYRERERDPGCLYHISINVLIFHKASCKQLNQVNIGFPSLHVNIFQQPELMHGLHCIFVDLSCILRTVSCGCVG